MTEVSGSDHGKKRPHNDVGKITQKCCKFCYVHNDLLLTFLNFKLFNKDASKYLCSHFDKHFYANDKEHEISLDDLIQNTENKNMLFSDDKFMIARLFHGKRPLSKQDDNKFTYYGSRKFNRKNPCLIRLDVVIREPQFKLR